MRPYSVDSDKLTSMPVIVVGADTEVGEAVVNAILPAAAEVRAFISDDGWSTDLKARGVKVALGDLSDTSHVEAAALFCFCAVLITDAALDGRELAFAEQAETVWAGWADAVRNAGVHRTIWVSAGSGFAGGRIGRPTAEVASVVDTDMGRVAAVVARLEEAQTIPDLDSETQP